MKHMYFLSLKSHVNMSNSYSHVYTDAEELKYCERGFG
jgi:hypothetical protein